MSRIHNVSVSFCNGDVQYQSYPDLKAALRLYLHRCIAAITGTNQAFPGQRDYHVYLVTLMIKEPRHGKEPKMVHHFNSGFFDCAHAHEEVRSG